ncbi:MAG: LLM class flavin-dependent oxidoreductase [Acidimicrobiia bacterium]|jgi:alkanesulfonate monooxygenase SsuD/methylene tetrahydromethanopterin reductase-like flavin-dependent oxidoreductase (luciferase family)
MRTSLFYLPGVGTREAVEQGGAGLRGDLYDEMLRDVLGQCQLADELGFNSVSFTEHHFHCEGFELSNNPVMLDLYVGLQTKRLRVGQLGIVLPANNPLRVAEDIAMLDRMTGGRANAGFARGYQRRWVDTMAQQTHGVQGVRPHEHDRIDDTNRAAFEENLRIIKRAWTEDYFSHRGQFWQVPPPGTPWNIEATERWGSGVRNGVVTELAVVPKPLQKPHPPIFQPFASSERTIRFCAEEGITPILPPLHPLLERRLIELYAEVSGKAPGEGVGVLRDLIVADTDSEALQIWMDGPVFCGASWFRPFGFDKGMLHPDTGAEFDGDRFAEGLAFVGTVDTVTRQLETLRGRIPVEWVFAWNYNGLVDDGRIRHSMEAWRSTIVPRVAAWD